MISNVLISGAGIAGPTLAFWLTRAGIRTTIVERAPSLPTAGQQIDVRGASLDIVRSMGLEDVVRSKTTHEQGLAFIDKKGKAHASFGVDTASGQSFSSDIEILRGELASIFYDATKDHTNTFSETSLLSSLRTTTMLTWNLGRILRGSSISWSLQTVCAPQRENWPSGRRTHRTT